jgi:small-conductance mechanosensitive channel
LSLPFALLLSAAVLALLVALLSLLRRSFFLVRQLSFPLAVAALALTLWAFALVRPGALPWLGAARSWLLLFLGLVTILRLLALFLFDVHLLGQRGVRLPPLLPAVAMALVYLLTALVTLKLAFPAFDVGPLLATSAVTSLVLGLALQPILANFFAGLVISLERPFRINDWIRVGEEEGRVVAITWRTTHLRTRDNDNIVIPNGKLAEERVHNFYYPHPLHLARVRVAVEYAQPPYRVRRVLADCAAGVHGVLDKPSADVFVTAFEESGIAYELRVWIEDAADVPRIASDLRSRIWEELRRKGMSFASPTRNVELVRPRRGSSRRGGSAPAAAGPAGLLRRPTALATAPTPVAIADAAAAADTTLEIAPADPATPAAVDDAAASEVPSGLALGAVAPPVGARLYLLEGPERGRALELHGDPVTIGRSRQCTLPLTDPNASKEHLSIAWENGGWVLTDLGSSFGTRLNGMAVSRAALSPLDRITIGDTTMIFEIDET